MTVALLRVAFLATLILVALLCGQKDMKFFYGFYVGILFTLSYVLIRSVAGGGV